MKHVLCIILLASAVAFFTSSAAGQGKGKGKGKGKSGDSPTATEKGKPDKVKGSPASPDAKEGKGPGGTDGQAKVLENVVNQMEKEEDKHRERVARLEAIRDKLAEKGNTTAAARLEEVLQKENDRYKRAMDRLKEHNEEATKKFDERMKKLSEEGSTGKGKSAEKGTDKEKGKGVTGKEDKAKGGKGKESGTDADKKSEGNEGPALITSVRTKDRLRTEAAKHIGKDNAEVELDKLDKEIKADK